MIWYLSLFPRVLHIECTGRFRGECVCATPAVRLGRVYGDGRMKRTAPTICRAVGKIIHQVDPARFRPPCLPPSPSFSSFPSRLYWRRCCRRWPAGTGFVQCNTCMEEERSSSRCVVSTSSISTTNSFFSFAGGLVLSESCVPSLLVFHTVQ